MSAIEAMLLMQMMQKQNASRFPKRRKVAKKKKATKKKKKTVKKYRLIRDPQDPLKLIKLPGKGYIWDGRVFRKPRSSDVGAVYEEGTYGPRLENGAFGA